MQPTDNLQKRLKDLTLIYAKAKQMILLAEELDPSFRSNIMVIKELRDSNDHLMRLFSEWIVNEDSPKNEEYMFAQIDKARGHVFRAGYDAIDGVVVSYKIKVAKALDKVSNGAIADVYPEYYTHAVVVDGLCEKVANHRNNKDVGEDSLQNLVDYAEEAKKVAEFCKIALAKVPLMLDWEKKNRKKLFLENVLMVFIVGIVIALLGAFATVCFERIMHPAHSEIPAITKAVPATNLVLTPKP